MKTFRKSLSILLMLFIFILSGCEKEEYSNFKEPKLDDLIEDYERNKVSTRTALSEAVEAVKAIVDDKKEKYERKYGIIQWNNYLQFDYYNSKIVIVPSIMENETNVNSLLFASFSSNGQVKYKFYDREKILNAKEKKNASKSNNKYTELTKELGLSLLIHMDTEVYGKTDCDLVNQLDNIRSSSTTRAYCSGYIIVQTTTTWYQVNGDGTVRELDSTTSYDFYGLCTEGNSDSYEDEYGDPTPPADPYEDVPEDDGNMEYLDETISYVAAGDGLKLDDDDEDINSCELALIIQYPFCARKIKDNRDVAYAKTEEVYGYNGRDDCSDAFRHALFNALNTISCGDFLAKKFGDAHECKLTDDRLDKQMDLYNNSVGRSIASYTINLTDIVNEILRIQGQAQTRTIVNGELVSTLCNP